MEGPSTSGSSTSGSLSPLGSTSTDPTSAVPSAVGDLLSQFVQKNAPKKVAFVDFWGDFEPWKFPFGYQFLERGWEIAGAGEEPDLVVGSVFGSGKKNRLYEGVPLLMVSYENYSRWIFYSSHSLDCSPDFYISNNTRNALRCGPDVRFFHSSIGTVAYCTRSTDKYALEGAGPCRLLDRSFLEYEETLDRKKAFCSFVFGNSSNDEGAIYRENFFHELSRYKKVDAAGASLNNTTPLAPRALHEYIPWTSRYKFCICFENSSGEGYYTEKPIHPYLAGTVPVYWGHPSALDVFNPESMVFCSSVKEGVRRVIELDSDPDLYTRALWSPSLKDGRLPSSLSEKALVSFVDTIIDEIQ